MGTSSLTKTTLIVPRSDLSEAVKELSGFEWFHPLSSESRDLDPTLDELTSRALKLQVDLEELVRDLDLQMEPGIIDILRKGYSVEQKTYTAKDWSDLIQKVEDEAEPIAVESRQLLEEKEITKKKLSDNITLKFSLEMISNFSVDLDIISSLNHFHVLFAVVSLRNLREIKRSLPEVIVVDSIITKSESAILIASAKTDKEKVEKILRSFEIKPFTIPSEMPQNPLEAFRIVKDRVTEFKEQNNKLNEELRSLIERIQQRLLMLYETSTTAHKVLNQMRRSGDLKRFGIIRGYVPTQYTSLFSKRFSHWISFTERVGKIEHGETHPPTLSTNKGITKAFDKITANQGPPVYTEVDPTPILSITFPIFFGIMFADLGHGLALLAFSIFLYMRGSPDLKKWATIFMLSGISASIGGVMIGEFFGFGIKKIIPQLGFFEVLEVVDHAHHSLSLEAIMTLLVFSWVLGIIHIGIGLTLNIVSGIKERDGVELLIEKIPTFFLFVFSVLFGLSFVGAGLGFGQMFTSTNPLPLIPFLTTSQGTVISLSGALPMIGILMFGKAVAIKMGKIHGESFGDAIMMNPIETLFEKLPGFLANTISYARLGILLVVHAALLIATNMGWNLGLAGIPIIIVSNILIIMLEGLIVYIQTLRLHLYEWFTKFYDGTGEPFQKLVPETNRVKINWK